MEDEKGLRRRDVQTDDLYENDEDEYENDFVDLSISFRIRPEDNDSVLKDFIL